MAVYWGASSGPRSSRHKHRDLPSEFRLFASFTKQLKKIIYDSNISLAELRSSGHFEEERISALCLQDDDERFVQSIVSDSPCILILGQTFTCKAAIVNRVFGDRVIRLIESPEEVNRKSWRTIRFKYGSHRRSCLALTDSYELVNGDLTPETPWREIPLAEVELREEHKKDAALANAIADITLNHALLATKTQVVVASHNCPNSDVIELFKYYSQRTLPIIVYGIDSDRITQQEQSELLELKAAAPDLPVLFIDCQPSDDSPVLVTRHVPPRQRPVSDTDPEDDSAYDTDEPGMKSEQVGDDDNGQGSGAVFRVLYQQLKSMGYVKDAREVAGYYPGVPTSEALLANSKLERLEPLLPIVQFVRQALQLYLVRAASIVHDLHQLCMNMFITAAFDMQRDIQITPRRIEYAKVKETELFESLKELANERQEQIKKIIMQTVEELKESVLEEAANFQFKGIDTGENDQIINIKDIKRCTEQIQDLVLARLNSAIVEKLISSVEYLHESFVGTLTRCLRSLEEIDTDSDQSASSALGQILNAAYQVEVNVRTSSSIVRVIWERMKEILQTMKPFKAPPKVNGDWKRKVALTMINNLDESKLAKSICSQFRARLHNSHDSFSSSLRQLEAKHSGRLEKTEEQRMKVRKVHAPRLARLALDSTSLRDMVLHGMPRLEREIGRGQYGVVYGCRSWGGMSPCAVKSVVPPDDKHWNDLALEFHYTRSIPEHARVVALRGSVIDHTYGSGTPAVLLIMERLQQDLHTAIKKGLDFPNRLQVALDVVEGIRYLHSLGLVHRDIKLKNVLLDKHDRGKITDLGFCKPEAMMSGSIVGTPIHMAPELFSGRYDSSVDTYAFGILLWYVCAGNVRLPQAFEQCANKDHLWSSVKKGVRPERLVPQFNDECWSLMQACWNGEPAKRPLLGEVSTRLQEIHLQASVVRKLSTSGRTRTDSNAKMASL